MFAALATQSISALWKVKIDMLGNIAEVLVRRSDHGEKGGSGVALNNPGTKVDDDIAV